MVEEKVEEKMEKKEEGKPIITRAVTVIRVVKSWQEKKNGRKNITPDPEISLDILPLISRAKEKTQMNIDKLRFPPDNSDIPSIFLSVIFFFLGCQAA